MTTARQQGFTLIELLVSMTLLGFVFVLLFGGLRFGTRAWDRGGAETDATDTVRLVQAFVRNEIERTCPRRIPAAHSSDQPHVNFSGSTDQVSFLAPEPQSYGAASCARVTLSVAPDGRFEQLVLGVGATDGDGEQSETVLLRHAQSITLSYLGGPGADWRSGWNDAADLPALVRLRVAFPGGDARVWPEMFVATRMSAEADCTYDPKTKSCQGGS